MLSIPKAGTVIETFVVPYGFSDLIKKLENYLEEYEFVNVMIAGSSCSGKSTLADFLENYYTSSCRITRINQDNYFRNLKDMVHSEDGYPIPDSLYSFYFMEYREDIKRLLKEGQTLIPEYDIAMNRRISKTKLVKCEKLQIFEGLHTIRILEDLPVSIKVFMDTDENVCLERKIKRDIAKYQVSKNRIIERWNQMILPMYQQFGKPQKAKADVILKSF